ncbi:MAG: hypothetical protein M3353_09960, partial [Actinomycetota bacterium]|nr:hypothetical protein [Actinomycetota bacterium]
MSRRTVSWLAWSLFGFYVTTLLTTLGLIAWGDANVEQGFVVIGVGFALVGALVARREPANAVGWLLLATALSVGLQELAVAYLDAADGPARLIAAWLALQLGWLYFALVLLPLVFPTGRLLSPRWRWAVWAGLGGALI